MDPVDVEIAVGISALEYCGLEDERCYVATSSRERRGSLGSETTNMSVFGDEAETETESVLSQPR